MHSFFTIQDCCICVVCVHTCVCVNIASSSNEYPSIPSGMFCLFMTMQYLINYIQFFLVP